MAGRCDVHLATDLLETAAVGRVVRRSSPVVAHAACRFELSVARCRDSATRAPPSCGQQPHAELRSKGRRPPNAGRAVSFARAAAPRGLPKGLPKLTSSQSIEQNSEHLAELKSPANNSDDLKSTRCK